MTRVLRMAMFVAFASAAGCAADGAEPYVPDGPPPEPFEIDLWVDDHPELLHNSAVAGCDIWYPEGVRCEIVADPRDADVRVYASDRPCDVRDDGTFTLATAFGDGSVVFETKCMGRLPDGRLDPRMFRTVMGHEVGHQLGIWSHVPESCDEPHATHPTGGPLCGQALMNPMYDANISFETALDHLAFEMRDRDASVIPDRRLGGSGDPLCVFTGSF